VTPSILVDRY